MSSAYMLELSTNQGYKQHKNAYKSHSSQCRECKRYVKQKQRTLDHKVPMALYGGSAFNSANWQVLCVPCHRKKTTLENKAMSRCNGLRIVTEYARL